MVMNTFSVLNYEKLSESQKADFNKALANRLLPFMKDIKVDDVLDDSAIVEFVVSSGESDNALAVVANLYSSVSSGIQVGSGNQQLFHGILSAIKECWDSINK